MSFKNNKLHKFIAQSLRLIAIAWSFAVPAYAQPAAAAASSITSPESLRTEAASAEKAKDFPRAQRALASLVEIAEREHGVDSNQAITARKGLADVQDNHARALLAAGRYGDAAKLFAHVLTERERRTGAVSAETAVALSRLSEAQDENGETAAALANARRALAVTEKVHGPDAPNTGARLNDLAVMYRELALYSEALPMYERALAISLRNFGDAHFITGIRLANLGALQAAMGNYGTALDTMLRALSVTEKARGPEHRETAIRLNNLGLLYRTTGNHAEALGVLRRALAITEKLQGPDHPDTGIRLSNLGQVMHALGRHDEALTLLRRAQSITERAFGPDHPQLSTRLNNIARVLEDNGDITAALPLYERALAIAQKALGPDHPGTGISINNLATANETAGRVREATALYQRALAVNEKSLGADHPATAETLDNLAGAYQREGQTAQAEALTRRVIAIAMRSGNAELLWKALGNRQTDLTRAGDIDAAIFFGKQSVNVLQGMRASLSALDRETQRAFLRRKTGVYRELADLLIRQGRLAEAQHVLGMLKEEEYFEFVRRTEGDDPRQRRIPLSAHEQSWHERLAALNARATQVANERAQLERMARAGDTGGAKRLAALRDTSASIDSDMQRFFDDFSRTFSASRSTSATKGAADGADAKRAEVQRLLASMDGSVLLQFIVSEQRLSVLLTTPSQQIARQTTVSSAALHERITAFREALRSPGGDVLPHAQALYRWMIAPIEAELKAANARTLMIAPDGALRYIPLAALHDGSQYLVERFDIALYTEVARETLAHRPGKAASIAGLGLTRKIDEFSPLPAVRGELQAIVRAGAANGNQGLIQGELHFDEQFNATTLRQALTRKHPLVHIASHFVFRPGNESTSFLLLGDGDRLTLSRIRQERLDFSHAELVTLSACETGVGGGRSAQGEEVEGLGALIQKQGAKGVIATLWPVADASTGLLMQQFYQLRETQKSSKASALRQAQLALIQGKHQPGAAANTGAQRGLTAPAVAKPATGATGYAHPYYWAPFILMGNWL